MSVAPVEVERPDVDEVVVPDEPWVTIVWNDPVNLMSYVTYVFQTYFGYSKEKATAADARRARKGPGGRVERTREEMERDTEAMHGYGLWATFQKDE